MMKKLSTLLILLVLVGSVGFADEVYESQGAGGVPDFSDQPSNTGSSQEMNVSNPLLNPGNDSPQQTLEQQSQGLNAKLQAQQSHTAMLKQQLDEAQTALDTAKQNLEQAHAAQDAGLSTVGGDQILNDDLIRHLEQQLAIANINYQEALDAYNNYVNDPDASDD